jgi:hypothetical protein
MNIVEDEAPKSAGVPSKKKNFRKLNQSEQIINRKMEHPTSSKYLQIKQKKLEKTDDYISDNQNSP